MATAPVRVALKTRLVTLLAAEASLSGVQVTLGHPGRDIRAECVWVGRAAGPVEVPAMTAGRKRRQDTPTIDIHCLAGKPGQTATVAETRAETLAAAVDDVIADDPTLGDLDGVIHATVTRIDGPDSDATDEGWVALCVVQVEILTRLN